jgi:tetratricopeptide (TPR) repeat protein
MKASRPLLITLAGLALVLFAIKVVPLIGRVPDQGLHLLRQQKAAIVDRVAAYEDEQADEAHRELVEAALAIPIDEHLPPLSPVDSGFGILIPDLPENTAKHGRFANGCNRWLQAAVGGHGALDKTPLWSHFGDFYHRRVTSFPGALDLSPEEAREIAAAHGLTHVAASEIEEDGEVLTLRYQWRRFPEDQPFGQPVEIQGTREQIRQGLPRTARALLTELGVNAPEPSMRAVGETAEELRRLGGLPWIPVPSIAGGEMIAIEQAVMEGGSRPAYPLLAAMMFVIYRGLDEDFARIKAAAGPALKAYPRHPMLLAELAYQSRRTDRANAGDLRLPGAAPALKRYPNNTLLQLAEVYRLRIDKKPSEARKLSERAVRSAPENVNTWLALGGSIGDEANLIRRRRFIDQMTEQELTAANAYYEDEFMVAVKAVQVGPQNTSAWRRLSGAAATGGAPELAVAALEEAFRLDPNDYTNHWWGMQLYQPKWIGDREMLRATAERCVAGGTFWSSWQRVLLARIACEQGVQDVGEKIVSTDRERQELVQALNKHAAQHRHED